MNQVVKSTPSVHDGMFVIGLLLLATGISFHWGWPVACEAIGFIIAAVAIAAKLRGNE
ncbi:MAG: hypothetical protein V3V40_06215 [Nitrosomonadaceae bacterium]